MLKKAKKKISKNQASFQFQFNIMVKSAEFIVNDKKWVPGKLTVEWKRNARVASTRGVSADVKLTGTNVVSFQNEELSMLGNLHRDENVYDPKEYKFSLEDIREKKSKKTLGTAAVDLAKFATLTGESFERSFELEVESSKISSGKITLIISSRFIGEGKDDDEMSVTSAVSNQHDDKGLHSSGSEESLPAKTREKSSATLGVGRDDDHAQELLEKIKSSEQDLVIARNQNNGKDESQKELEQLKTKIQIDQERQVLALESLKREKEEAEEEIKILEEKLDKEKLKYERQIEVFKEELKEAKEMASKKEVRESESDEAQTDDDLYSLEKEKEQWESEREALEKEKEKEKESFEAERVLWEEEREEMESRIKQLTEKEKGEFNEEEELNQEIQKLEKENKGLKATISRQNDEITSLKEELEKFQEEKEASLQGSNSHLEESVSREKKLQSKIESLEEKCITLTQNTGGKDSGLVESLQNRVSELESELEETTNSSSVKIKELQSLVSSFRVKSQDDGENLTKEIAALKAENAELKEQIEHLQQKVDEAPEHSRQAEDQDDEMSDKEKFQEYERQVRSANADLAELRKKYDKLSNMYKSQEEVIENLTQNASTPTRNGVSDDHDENRGSGEKKLSEEIETLTNELITAKMSLAEGQFLYEKMRQSKKEAAQQLAAEKLKTLELRKKLTQFEVKYAGK